MCRCAGTKCAGTRCAPYSMNLMTPEDNGGDLELTIAPHMTAELDDIWGRGSHSSTFRLNVSTFCAIRWVHDSSPVYSTGGHGEV